MNFQQENTLQQLDMLLLMDLAQNPRVQFLIRLRDAMLEARLPATVVDDVLSSIKVVYEDTEVDHEYQEEATKKLAQYVLAAHDAYVDACLPYAAFLRALQETTVVA